MVMENNLSFYLLSSESRFFVLQIPELLKAALSSADHKVERESSLKPSFSEDATPFHFNGASEMHFLTCRVRRAPLKHLEVSVFAHYLD